MWRLSSAWRLGSYVNPILCQHARRNVAALPETAVMLEMVRELQQDKRRMEEDKKRMERRMEEDQKRMEEDKKRMEEDKNAVIAAQKRAYESELKLVNTALLSLQGNLHIRYVMEEYEATLEFKEKKNVLRGLLKRLPNRTELWDFVCRMEESGRFARVRHFVDESFAKEDGVTIGRLAADLFNHVSRAKHRPTAGDAVTIQRNSLYPNEVRARGLSCGCFR
jgi:hypothetical protein